MISTDGIIGPSSGASSETDGDERGRCVPTDGTAEHIARSRVEAVDRDEEKELEEHNSGRDNIIVERVIEN